MVDDDGQLLLAQMSSPIPALPAFNTHPLLAIQPSPSLDVDHDVDPQILEALRSKDRLYVLKLGELMEGLINDRRARIDLAPATSYQRLLVHRCSAFYKLAPESDPNTKGIIVVPTLDSRVPARRLCDLVPPEATTAPAFKIMRRSQPDRRSNRTQSSNPGSVPGDDQDLSDPEPSESGSQGGRSNPTGRSNKSRLTIEEREAAYNEARSRIFMGFEEKEKEKDLSASSSSLSLVSGSASTSANGGSSVSGDLDESVGTPATESEFSAPSREKKDFRYPGKNASASSSQRSLRSYPTSSSRNSRAPSPSSFTYPNIYEPNQITYYDHSQPPPGYNPSHQYVYPYSPHGAPPNPYYSAYPYYQPPYPFQSPPQSASDPSTPSSADHYMSPPPNGGAYPHQYAWQPPHPMHSPPHMQQPPPQAPPPPQQYPYMHPPPHSYTYPVPTAYYPVPPPIDTQSPPAHSSYDVPRSLNGSSMGQQGNGHGRNGFPAGNGHSHGGGNRGGNRHNSLNGAGAKGRGPPPMNQGRAAWSYGPGVGQGGFVTSPAEIIGPRLNNRRTSNNSGSSTTSRSSNCDDVASTTSSSTTSSSSRRTYTSTTSSQHPLPARPDWAVGLKPQPTLHATQPRHHDHNNPRTMSPISPPRNLNGHGHHHQHNHPHTNNSNGTSAQQQPVPLQSPTEFPPLSSTPEKRVPVVSGAWGNTSSTRNIRVLSPGQNAPSALVHHPSNGAISNSASATAQALAPGADAAEESDRAFERPPPKSSAELFNPKLLRRPAPAGPGKAAPPPPQSQEKENPIQKGERTRSDVVSNAILVERAEALSLEDKESLVA
ncbi:hypothetical protein C0991_002076 [Blastosporella zonata]|nr:hypothetical protein C0991_002076 [Blastosporella zonata]